MEHRGGHLVVRGMRRFLPTCCSRALPGFDSVGICALNANIGACNTARINRLVPRMHRLPAVWRSTVAVALRYKHARVTHTHRQTHIIYVCAYINTNTHAHARARACVRVPVRVRVRVRVRACVFACMHVHMRALPVGVDRVRLGAQAFHLANAFNANIGAWNIVSVSNMAYVCATSSPVARHRGRPGTRSAGLGSGRSVVRGGTADARAWSLV